MVQITWGDVVKVRELAPASMRPGASGDVVGVTEVNTACLATEFGVPLGGWVYLVEFGDGEAIEVPEGWLERDKP